ncbi:MAG: 50S ribosomal protein L40e [Candidatus Woesearchaeota archaeon]
MAKFPEANARLFKNIFICKKCKSRIRAPQMKVLQGKISCRKCASRALRVVRMK